MTPVIDALVCGTNDQTDSDLDGVVIYVMSAGYDDTQDEDGDETRMVVTLSLRQQFQPK